MSTDERSRVVSNVDLSAPQRGVAEEASAFDRDTRVLRVDDALRTHEEELLDDGWIDGT